MPAARSPLTWWKWEQKRMALVETPTRTDRMQDWVLTAGAPCRRVVKGRGEVIRLVARQGPCCEQGAMAGWQAPG